MSEPLVPSDPQAVALFRLDRAQLPQYLTRDQIAAMIAKCRRPRDSMFIRVGFETGGRVSELLELVRTDVDLVNGQIRLRTSKRRTDRRKKIIDLYRWVPVSHALRADLSVWFTKRTSEKLDGDWCGLPEVESRVFPFTRQAAFNIVRRIGRNAGVVARGGRNVSPHILRHSFAMNCLTQGVPISIVQELLGHASVINTMAYLKTDPAQAREFLSKVQF